VVGLALRNKNKNVSGIAGTYGAGKNREKPLRPAGHP
jgi:hypothetical protein